MVAPSSPIRKGAVDILRETQQLPVLSPSSEDVRDGVLAWGVGVANWTPTTTNCLHPLSMKQDMRTLVAASFDIYARLQQLSDKRLGEDREVIPEEIIHASCMYREALSGAIFALEDRSESADDELIDILKVSLAIWHLCELVFLERRARDSKSLAYDVATWLKEHYCGARFSVLEAEVKRLSQTTNQVEQDAAFWPTVYSLVMSGYGAHAWALLSQHSTYQSLFTNSHSSSSAREVFDSIHRLLMCMPSSKNTQNMQWHQWHDACQHLRDHVTYVRDNAQLRTLLEIMTADPGTLSKHGSVWYELMMARLILEEPKAIAHRLEFLMAHCVKTYTKEENDTTMNNFDCIVLAILQYDVESVVRDIHALGFSWMAAHLSHLLVISHVLAGDSPLEASMTRNINLQEYFMLQYAIDLSPCSGLWPITAEYLAITCPRMGVAAIRSLLTRESLTTDAKAEQLIRYCYQKKGLVETQRILAHRRALECKRVRAYGTAIQWALQGQKWDECDSICEDVLDACEQQQSLSPLHEAVECLAHHEALAATSMLRWLVKYRELHMMMDDRVCLAQKNEEVEAQKEEKVKFVSELAAKRLSELITSTVAPRRLRGALLRIAADLLEASVKFSSTQLVSLQTYMRAIDRSFDRRTFYNDLQNGPLKKKVETLVTRYLAMVLSKETRQDNEGKKTEKEIDQMAMEF